MTATICPCSLSLPSEVMIVYEYSTRWNRLLLRSNTDLVISVFLEAGIPCDTIVETLLLDNTCILFKQIFNEMKIKEKSNIEKRMLHLRSELSLLDSQPSKFRDLSVIIAMSGKCYT